VLLTIQVLIAQVIGHQKIIHNVKVKKQSHAPGNFPTNPTPHPLSKKGMIRPSPQSLAKLIHFHKNLSHLSSIFNKINSGSKLERPIRLQLKSGQPRAKGLW